MNNRKLKVLVFLVGLAWGMMMPQMVHAQEGGGIFGLGQIMQNRRCARECWSTAYFCS